MALLCLADYDGWPPVSVSQELNDLGNRVSTIQLVAHSNFGSLCQGLLEDGDLLM